MKKILKHNYYKLTKHRRIANQKELNREDIKQIKSDFFSWIVNIEEDDPLPYEITNICFCFDFRCENVNLSLSGYENNIETIKIGYYCPLEAEYFNCESLNAFFNNKKNLNNKNELYYYVKRKIFNMFEKFINSMQNDNQFLYLNNKKIVIGEIFKPKDKSFTFHCNN